MQLFEQVLKELEKWELRLRNAERRIDWLEKKDENPVDGTLTGSVQGGGTYGGGGSTALEAVTERKKEGDRESKGKGETVTNPENILPEFPELNTPEVRSALSEWYAYRRERKLAKWQMRTLRVKLEELRQYGPSGLVASVRASIGNGYQGLFAPEADAAKAKPNAQAHVMKPIKPTADDEIRDEWFKLNSRAFGFVPKWVGVEAAKADIPKIKDLLRRKREQNVQTEPTEVVTD